MFIRGVLISFVTTTILYFLLPFIYIDPVRWMNYSNSVSEWHIQYMLRMTVAMIVSIPVGGAFGWKRKMKKLWFIGYLLGVILTPALIGFCYMVYFYFAIAP